MIGFHVEDFGQDHRIGSPLGLSQRCRMLDSLCLIKDAWHVQDKTV